MLKLISKIPIIPPSLIVTESAYRSIMITLAAADYIKIADFGLPRLSEATNTRSEAHLNFAAPELFGLPEDVSGPSDDTPPSTQMSDVYAIGYLYYEVRHNKNVDTPC